MSMSGQRLFSSKANPIHTELKDEGGQLVYMTRPQQEPRDIFATEFISIRHNEGQTFALFEYNPSKGKPTITFSGQPPIPTQDLLRSAGTLTRARLFRAPNGSEYKWEICHSYLRLRSTEKDNDTDLAYWHYEVRYGRNKSPAYLELFYGLGSIQDLVVVTAILMETSRMWTNAKVDGYMDRVFSQGNVWVASMPGGMSAKVF